MKNLVYDNLESDVYNLSNKDADEIILSVFKEDPSGFIETIDYPKGLLYFDLKKD